MQAQAGIQVSQPIRQRLLKLFSDKLVRLLPLAVHIKKLCSATVREPADRRDWQSRKLFKQITNRSGHCLHHLLPAKRDETVTSRLRRSVELYTSLVC